MPLRQKRPCCICHRWFLPDNRVGSRQRACRQADCQAQRRRKQQSAWRARHPDYFAARRIQARMVLDEPPAPLRLPPPLDQLPWDIAQSEFGVQGADFLGVMGGLLLRSKQSQLVPYLLYSTRDPATLLASAAQSQIPPAAYLGGSDFEDGHHAAGIPPT
jgi:hypothetical protein